MLVMRAIITTCKYFEDSTKTLNFHQGTQIHMERQNR